MEFRTLRQDELEALLDLLDGWDVGDGWRGADFFRRYLVDDPTFEPRHLFVASEGGALCSCVQVFPRPLRLGGEIVPSGGIGSVYTAPSHRKRGLAETLLERAVASMRAEGMLVSLLFGIRIPWYTKQGWVSHPVERWVLKGPSQDGLAGDAFEAGRDLPEVRALYDAYGKALPGSVVRDDALWTASLRNAGNPAERFRVWRPDGRVRAYTRCSELQGIPNLLEMGRAPGDQEALEALAGLLASEVGHVLVTPDLGFEPDLLPMLARHGVGAQPVEDPTAMLRCLDAPALAARLGTTLGSGESPEAFLSRVLPAGRLRFWPADRF